MSNYIKPFSFCRVLAYGLSGALRCVQWFFFLVEFFPFFFFSVNGVTRTCILGNVGRLKLLGFTILAVASPTNSGRCPHDVDQSSRVVFYDLSVHFNTWLWYWYLANLPVIWFTITDILPRVREDSHLRVSPNYPLEIEMASYHVNLNTNLAGGNSHTRRGLLRIRMKFNGMQSYCNGRTEGWL